MNTGRDDENDFTSRPDQLEQVMDPSEMMDGVGEGGGLAPGEDGGHEGVVEEPEGPGLVAAGAGKPVRDVPGKVQPGHDWDGRRLPNAAHRCEQGDDAQTRSEARRVVEEFRPVSAAARAERRVTPRLDRNGVDFGGGMLARSCSSTWWKSND